MLIIGIMYTIAGLLDREGFMKKVLLKNIGFNLIIVLLFLMISGCSFKGGFSFNFSKSSHIITGSSTGNDTLSKDYDFEFREGDRIVFQYKSVVKRGSLEIKLIDPDGNSVYTFETGKKGEKEIKIIKTGTYKIIVSGSSFSGNYEIKWI